MRFMAGDITLCTETTVKGIAYRAFIFMQKKGLIQSLFAFKREKQGDEPGEKLFSFEYDENHKLNSLFLKATKESVIRKNNKIKNHSRWFEEPFKIGGEDLYLTDQWNGTGDYSLSLSNLNFFLKELCKKDLDGTICVIKKIDEKNFALVQTVSEGDGQDESISDRKKGDEGRPPMKDKYAFPRQKVLFGAPGTGKSFRIDDSVKGFGLKIIDESRKFRTTFHPDYDYAQFVGSYKPIKTSSKQQIFEKKTLLEKLIQAKESLGSYPLQKFSVSFYNSFESLSPQERKNIVLDAGFDESMNTELGKGMAIGRYLEEQQNAASITYTFIPQVFAKAYASAWKQYFSAGDTLTTENQVYLVIEEINRGNCAQIFGDIFQLLDRDADGFSQYSIDADCDFAEWLKTNDNGLKSVWSAYEKKVGDGKLKLPPNLNILATMNTSDQSLFPMDSAFKRRFDWEYVPIKYAKDSDCGDDWKADEFKIVIGDSTYMWLDFLKKVNADIYDATQSEDKQMGEFFIKPKRDNLEILFDDFRSKVLFYLWDSVYKDETERQAVFHFPYGEGDEKIKSVTFQSLFGKDAEGIVNKIMENLKVEKVTA